MASVTTVLMRCTTPHWQGNKFVDAGTVLPKGHPDVIPIYFTPFEYQAEVEPTPAAKTSQAKPKADAGG